VCIPRAVSGAIVILVACATARADWPQFLGPTRDGKSAETGLDRTLGGGKPKVLWTLDVGVGYAAAAIRDGKVFVLDREDDARDVLRCLDLSNGAELWRYGYEAPGKLSHNGSRSTPAVDDKYVFTVGPFGQFHCISRATHKPVWSKHLLEDFAGKRPRWGVPQNPLLYRDWVVVAPQGQQVGMIACERATGKIVWRSPSLGRLEYASPIPAKLAGVEQIMTLSNDRVVGVSGDTGKLLWTYKGWNCRIPIPSPIPVGDDRVFITGGYGAGSVMIRIVRSGESFRAQELWKTKAIASATHQPILVDGHLYIDSNTKKIHRGLLCMDLDGKVKWETGRRPNFERGNLIYADGLFYNADGVTGILHLIEVSPREYKELAQAKLLGGREIWAPMALSDGKLVLRDQRQMKCIPVK